MMRAWCLSLVLVSLLAVPRIAAAQDADSPTFELSSGETFTTRGRATFGLGYRHLTQLDFRVYKVRDPFAFFAGLRDPHQLGGPEQPVPKERSWIERLTIWKREQRSRVRQFFRTQVSYDYRAQRRIAQDRQEIQRRVVLNRATFAQVPLLNPDQLVTSWREMLPDYRDFDYRTLPLDLTEEGIYVVEAVSGTQRAYTIVMISNVGLVTKAAPREVLAFAADRLTGEPISGCDVQVIAGGRAAGRGQTAEDGVLRLTLPEERIENAVTVARCGDRVAVADARTGYFSEEGERPLVGYIYTDKPIYRPGHTVRIKGVLRWRDREGLVPFDRTSVELAVSDTTGKVIARQRLDVDEFGSVNSSILIPVAAALGDYTIRLNSGQATAIGSFEVQEYRRPEFEVAVTPAARFVKQGDTAVAAIQARYYFGQPVANARVTYRVSRNAYTSPYRYSDAFAEEFGEFGSFGYGTEIDQGELRLDAQGRGTIELQTPVVDEYHQDYDLTVEATVTDASSRDISNSTTIHATYGTFMVVARVDSYLYRGGQTVPVQLRAVDYMGAARGNLPVTVFVEHYRNFADAYQRSGVSPTRIGESRATLDADGNATVQVTLGRDAGSYRIVAVAMEGDRQIAGNVSVYVPGGDIGSNGTGDEYVEVVPDKRTYVPGETAQLLVRGQPLEGPVLVTKEGDHVMWHAVLRATAGQPLSVPIDAADTGDVYVSLISLRDGRVRRAERRLGVSVAEKTLTIALASDRPSAKPQEATTYSVRVTDASGMPVRAQLSLGVIDEAIYAIKPDTTPDPVRFFHRRDYSRVIDGYSGSYYFSGYAGTERLQLAGRRRRPFTLADFKGDREVQPQVRKDFSDAIYWIANLVTAADGTAKVTLKYPDQLTTWRLTARAITTDTKAGAGIARTVTTKDLIVRVIAPRFLTEGDRVTIPGIAHNYTDVDRETTFGIAATGLAPEGTTPASVVSTISAGGERRQDWQFVANTVGTASLTGTAKTDADTDAVELPLPVVPYGLRRETGSSGTLSDDTEAAADVSIPAAANASGRIVRVLLAPSIAGSLLGSLDYLTSYPYGCTEQTLSSFVPNLVVTRALAQLKLEPTERLSTLDRQVAAGLNRLMDYQHEDGGWGWWKADANHPFMTAYAVDGLMAARDAGYSINTFRLQNAIRSLARQYLDSPTAVPDLKAYLLFVLGRAVPATESVQIPSTEGVRTYRTADALNELWNARSRMSSYGRALLLLALDNSSDSRGSELAAQLLGEAQTQGELSFWESTSDPLLLDIADTSVEATATAVRALARRDPGNPILDRAVRWMMLKRTGGYWYSTKQTAMALYGLLELLQARNESPSAFTADVYVNGTLAGSRTFTPASLTNPEPVEITAAAREGANHVRIVKRGGGTLYWSATSVYFDPTAAEGRSGSRRLAIQRTYQRLQSVRNSDGTFSYREVALTGPVQPGDVLTVHLVVAGSPDWSYLAIADPLPAGFEGVRDTSAYPLVRDMRFQFWSGARTEYRDDRTLIFEPTLQGGRNEYVYAIKAISGGTFRAVPAQVAPMYVPDVSASSEPFTVTVAASGEPAR